MPASVDERPQWQAVRIHLGIAVGSNNPVIVKLHLFNPSECGGQGIADFIPKTSDVDLVNSFGCLGQCRAPPVISRASYGNGAFHFQVSVVATGAGVDVYVCLVVPLSSVKGGERVYHCGGGIVYHRHDEKGLNWEPGGVKSGAVSAVLE